MPFGFNCMDIACMKNMLICGRVWGASQEIFEKIRPSQLYNSILNENFQLLCHILNTQLKIIT